MLTRSIDSRAGRRVFLEHHAGLRIESCDDAVVRRRDPDAPVVTNRDAARPIGGCLGLEQSLAGLVIQLEDPVVTLVDVPEAVFRGLQPVRLGPRALEPELHFRSLGHVGCSFVWGASRDDPPAPSLDGLTRFRRYYARVVDFTKAGAPSEVEINMSELPARYTLSKLPPGGNWLQAGGESGETSWGA